MLEREPNIGFAASVVSREKIKELLHSPDRVQEYSIWLKKLPREVRSIVEAHLTNSEPKIYDNSLPLCREFLFSTHLLLKNPQLDLSALKIDPRVRERLLKLQKIPLEKEGKFVNLFSLLANKEVGFGNKALWYEAQAASRYEWLKIEDLKEVIAGLEQEKLIFDESDEPESYEPHRVKKQENEGLDSKSCLAVVMPFYGGYYKDSVYEDWDGASLTWKKSPRRFASLAQEEILVNDKHYYVSKALSRRMNIIKLPYNWGVDPKSVMWQEGEPSDFGIFTDQNGETYISIKDEDAQDFTYTIEIAPKVNPNLSKPEAHFIRPVDKLPKELVDELERKIGHEDQIAKARRIVKFIRDHLEYNDDLEYEAIYKQNPAVYFETIWKYKKAKCDEANTMAVLALRKIGLQARFVGGHYVKEKDKKGAAIISADNRHAWLEVFDAKNKTWLRLDATPKGDPNLDDEKRDAIDGDFGEQDTDGLSEDDLNELRKQLENIEVGGLVSEPNQREQIAKELNIPEERITHILERIKDLRKLKDPQGRVVFEEAKKVWQKAILKNLSRKEVFYFPLRMNEGEDLMDPAMAMIDIDSGDYNPRGFEKREIEVQEEKFFGGLEVHIAADMSGSMADIDSLSGASKKNEQRDALFLFVDSLMANAALSRANSANLKTEMPVRVSLCVFGQEVKVVLPLTDKWTLKDQVRLYEELNKSPNGGTPDDEALRGINSRLKSSIIQEEKDKRRLASLGRKSGKINRFVAVFCDGGSNNKVEVRRIINSMRAQGTKIYGFGITSSSQGIRPLYEPDVEIIAQSNELAGIAMNKLIETIKDWYDIK